MLNVEQTTGHVRVWIDVTILKIERKRIDKLRHLTLALGFGNKLKQEECESRRDEWEGYIGVSYPKDTAIDVSANNK